jgi:tetratricopeptide (TPR) repeat protein
MPAPQRTRTSGIRKGADMPREINFDKCRAELRIVFQIVSVVLIATYAAIQHGFAASAGDWADCKSQTEKSITACTRILSDRVETHDDRALAYRFRGAAYLVAQKDKVRALADYNESIKLNPNDSESFAWRGAFYGTNGDNSRAIEDFDRALRIKPDDAPTLDSRGTAYMRMGQFQKAIEDLDAAWRKGKFVNSLYARGWAKRKTGDVSGGDADIAATRAQHPNTADWDKYYGIQP